MNISLAAEPIFHIGTLPITNTLIVSWLLVILLVAFSLLVKNKFRAVPGKLQNFLEFTIGGAFDFFDSIVGDRKQTRKFFPIVATIFIFVLLSNFVELWPGLGSIGIYEVHNGEEVLIPFIRSASADLNFTLAIAIVSVISTQILGIAAIGFFKYSSKFFNFRGPIQFFVGILELVSEFAKIISFSFRLFGNIFAGEVLLLVVGFLVPYIVPLPFLFLEIFVGLVQALVFSMLTLVFLKMAVFEHAH
ncbi:MAG TPA: F0F1 ATP synthase subunit A [Patescibacteria group bacterium]